MFEVGKNDDGQYVVVTPAGPKHINIDNTIPLEKRDQFAKEFAANLQANPRALQDFVAVAPDPLPNATIQTAPTPVGLPATSQEQLDAAKKRLLAGPDPQPDWRSAEPKDPLGLVPAAVPDAAGKPDMMGRIKQAAIDYLRSKDADKTAAITGAVAPGTNTEAAILATSMIPGVGEAALAAKLAPVFGKFAPGVARIISKTANSKFITPTVTGGIVGNLTDEGTATGLVKGAVQGIGNKAGGYLNRKLTGFGNTRFRMEAEDLAKMNTRFAPEAGAALKKSIPSLEDLQVPLNDSTELSQLLIDRSRNPNNIMARMGKLFDKTDNDIYKAVGKDTVDMPILFKETESVGQSATTRSGKATVTSQAATEATDTTTQSTDKLVSKKRVGKGTNKMTRVTTQPADGGPTSQTAKTGTTSRTAQSETTGEGQASRASNTKTTSSTGFDTQKMSMKDAIALMRKYREAADNGDLEDKRLAYEAAGAIFDKIASKDKALAERFQNLSEDYHKLMSFREAFRGKDAFFGDYAGGGFNPIAFAAEFQKHPHLLDRSAFGPVHEWMQGGGAKGAAPGKSAYTPFGGYFHLQSLPFSQHFGERGVRPAVNLPPALAKALIGPGWYYTGKTAQSTAVPAVGSALQHPGDSIGAIIEMLKNGK